jgi:hypothetical protein
LKYPAGKGLSSFPAAFFCFFFGQAKKKKHSIQLVISIDFSRAKKWLRAHCYIRNNWLLDVFYFLCLDANKVTKKNQGRNDDSPLLPLFPD